MGLSGPITWSRRRLLANQSHSKRGNIQMWSRISQISILAQLSTLTATITVLS